MLKTPYEVPRRWQVGDLCRENYYGNYLIIGVVAGIYNAYDIINEHGQQFQLSTPDGYQRSTGLHYHFTSSEQTHQDFQNGLFTTFLRQSLDSNLIGMKYAHELLAIECINALFWNYTREDIHHLTDKYPDLAYVWDTYIVDTSEQDAFNTWWECWMTKFNVATKNGLIDYALKKYGQQKAEALDSAYRMTAVWKRIENGDN